MKVAPDTNVLVRFFIEDDPRQNAAARKALVEAELILLSLTVLCELVWVLSRTYRLSRADIAGTIRGLLDAGNVVVDRPAVEAGLAGLEAGGDFADGVIAYEGERLGADTFLSFDKRAVRSLQKRGRYASLLA